MQPAHSRTCDLHCGSGAANHRRLKTFVTCADDALVVATVIKYHGADVQTSGADVQTSVSLQLHMLVQSEGLIVFEPGEVHAGFHLMTDLAGESSGCGHLYGEKGVQLPLNHSGSCENDED